MNDFKKLIETKKEEEESKKSADYVNSPEFERKIEAGRAVTEGQNIKAFAGEVLREFATHINAILEDNAHSGNLGYCSQAYTLYEKVTKRFLLIFPYESKGIEIMHITIGKSGGQQYRGGLFTSSNAFLIDGHDLSPKHSTNREWLKNVLAAYYAKLSPGPVSYQGVGWTDAAKIRDAY